MAKGRSELRAKQACEATGALCGPVEDKKTT